MLKNISKHILLLSLLPNLLSFGETMAHGQGLINCLIVFILSVYDALALQSTLPGLYWA